MQQGKQESETSRAMAGGLGAWILNRFRGSGHARPRLALVERITLAPRQSLALVEAEGRRFLVATSVEGTPGFYPLDGEAVPGSLIRSVRPRPAPLARRSW